MKNRYRKTLLIVEDEILLAIAKKMELEKCGYETIHAMTGEEAVSIIKDNDIIDLVLMDIDLGGGIDGIEAAGIILKFKDKPIIFVSSHSGPDVIEKTKKLASYGYVSKTSGISVLNSSIITAFELFDTRRKENQRITEDYCD